MKPALTYNAILLVLLAGAGLVGAQGEFTEPWARPDRGIVIDPYQENSIDWNRLSTDTSIVGIIHRASIGRRSDSRYAERRAEALKRGYRWGSYHLGRRGDPQGQADFYLQVVQPDKDEILALDIESLNAAVDISLDDARIFLTRVLERTVSERSNAATIERLKTGHCR
jgi:lysozyme